MREVENIVADLRRECSRITAPHPFASLMEEAADALEELNDFDRTQSGIMLQSIITMKQKMKAAEKCIFDIETYLQLGSGEFIKKTIDDWRNQEKT